MSAHTMLRSVRTNLSPSIWQDLLAGVAGAVAGAPLAMGFAIIAGVSPIYGLYTAAISPIVGSLSISSTFMTVGSTNALALVVGSKLTEYDSANHLEIVFTLTLLVGVFQFLFGLLRLGTLSRFVSNAVMTGFVSGASLLIIIGQLKNLTGVSGGTARRALPRLWHWLNHLSDLNVHILATGLLAIIIIVVLKRTRFKSLATLMAIVITSILVAYLHWDDVTLVRDMSPVPSGLPAPQPPPLNHVSELATAALAMAVLASVQSAALANIIPQPDGTTSNISRDFVGQGLANMVGSWFQCMPAGGSLSRTAINVAAGARSRLSNIFAGLIVIAILLSLGKSIERVTLAALAGQLIIAAISLINPKDIRLVWRVNWTARVVMLVTFCATLLLPLEFSIYAGVVISLLLYVYTSSSNIKIVRLVPNGNHQFREEAVGSTLPDNSTVIFSVSGNLYFAAVKQLEDTLPSPRTSTGTVVILRLRDNQYLGSTGIRFLLRYNEQLRAHGGKLILTGISPALHEQLERSGVVDEFGPENIFYANDILFSALEHALAITPPNTHENTPEASPKT